MTFVCRPLVFGLAATIFYTGAAFCQAMPLDEQIRLCAACHGEDGNSRLENIPSLAGQPEFFIFNQLFLMREGVRQVEPMTPFVKDLKDDDMDALAKHFAKLAAKPSEERIGADTTMTAIVFGVSDADLVALAHYAASH